jgi:hypothetical protein
MVRVWHMELWPMILKINELVLSFDLCDINFIEINLYWHLGKNN